MALSTYGGLKQAVADYLNRVDLDQQIPDFIRLAEATINKVVRSTRMVANGTVAVTANTRKATAPTDMLEPIYLQMAADEDYPLEQVSVQQLTMLRRARLRATGTPRFYSIVGRSIELAPTPASSGNMDVAYYQAIPALVADGDTNWLLTYEPDIYLYTTLLHAAPFLQDDQKTAVMENMVTKQVLAAVGMNKTVQLDSKIAGFSLDAPSDGPQAVAQ